MVNETSEEIYSLIGALLFYIIMFAINYYLMKKAIRSELNKNGKYK